MTFQIVISVHDLSVQIYERQLFVAHSMNCDCFSKVSCIILIRSVVAGMSWKYEYKYDHQSLIFKAGLAEVQKFRKKDLGYEGNIKMSLLFKTNAYSLSCEQPTHPSLTAVFQF